MARESVYEIQKVQGSWGLVHKPTGRVIITSPENNQEFKEYCREQFMVEKEWFE